MRVPRQYSLHDISSRRTKQGRKRTPTWISSSDNASGPVTPPDYRRRVNGIGCEQGQNIIPLPVPNGFEAMSKGYSSGLDLSERVRSTGKSVHI